MSNKELKETSNNTLNPIEVGVFTVLILFFIYSVYTLFYGWQESYSDQLNTIEPLTQNGNRSLASFSSSFFHLEVPCEKSFTETTSAKKVRILGHICGINQSKNKLIKTEIINKSNNNLATVFTDTHSKKYSTDYIPLDKGQNVINLKFYYYGGKTVSNQIILTAN